MENFRFEMTKVYSEIPPLQMAWNPGNRMWRLICIPRGYHSLENVFRRFLCVKFTKSPLCRISGPGAQFGIASAIAIISKHFQ